MSKLIGLNLNLSKLDKRKIKEVQTKDGLQKFINLTVSINDTVDNFGNNVSVWNEQTKEQLATKVNRVFCGNGKVVFSNDSTTNDAPAEYKAKSPAPKNDLPF